MAQDFVSIIITSHNESQSLEGTLASIKPIGLAAPQIIVIDDGSTEPQVKLRTDLSQFLLLRNTERMGVAYSRDRAASLATAKVFCFLDAHQHVEGDSVNQCAELADATQSIVCPDIADFDSEVRRHGAYFSMDAKTGFYSSTWKQRKPLDQYGRVSSLKAPAYFIPSQIYPIVCWSKLQRGWGGSEAMVSLKAFFADVPILHLCGPLIRHKFKTSFHYNVSWNEVWRNHAIIARICFEEETWRNYWLPQVFEKHLSSSVLEELESEEIRAEKDFFTRFKRRKDIDFWNDLIFSRPPREVLER